VAGVDGFVVCELVITDIPKIESAEVCALVGKCAVKPVLGILVLWGVVDLSRGYRSVYMGVPEFLVDEGVD